MKTSFGELDELVRLAVRALGRPVDPRDPRDCQIAAGQLRRLAGGGSVRSMWADEPEDQLMRLADRLTAAVRAERGPVGRFGRKNGQPNVHERG